MKAWDSYDAYLFDIDGTLLVCRDAVHYFGFCDVLSRMAGRPVNLDGVVAHGNVDNGILRDALRLAGIDEAAWRARLPAMQHELCAWVEAHAAELRAECTAGAPEALAYLQARGALLGVATGNLERIGWAKLRAAGLRQFFAVGSFSDRHEQRAEVVRAGVEQARARLGTGCAVCAVGDTPLDIEAARACGIDVLAVATGVYPAGALCAADRVAGSLAELLAAR